MSRIGKLPIPVPSGVEVNISGQDITVKGLEHLKELQEQVNTLRTVFKSSRICWVPREMNAEADRLVRDALGPCD